MKAFAAKATTKPQLEDVGDLSIDPLAEPAQGPAPKGTGKQETDFYTRAGKEYWALQANAQNLGLLGQMFGGTVAAPTNIAGLLAILMFLFIVGSMFATSTVDLIDARKIAFGVISSSLAFIFGAASKK